MEGLFIGRKNSYIEKVSKYVEELSLIAKGDNVEIMIQKVKMGVSITVCPGESEELMEFFYILKGSMSNAGNGVEKLTELYEGDYFYVNKLKDTVYFKTTSDVELMYVSTQPVFNLLSDEIIELKNILKGLEEKDLYTHGHDIRLCDYSSKIGEVLNLSKEQLERVYYATLFHDIGKVNTPYEILNKPGKLTSIEYDIIKTHPIDGKNLMDKTFLRSIGEIIAQHHERLDGSGYPNKLMGEAISIEAKIIAVVDSYDAMISDRPYRKAMSHDEAIKDLKRLSGIQYDERIVDILEEILKVNE